MKPQKRERIVNVSLFVLTALLFVSMLLLCYANIKLMSGGTTGSASDLPASEKWQLAGGVSDGRGVSLSLIRPCVVGEKTEDGTFLAVSDGDSYETYEKRLGEALGAVFGGRAVVRNFTSEEERARYADDITNSERFVYGALYAALPLETLPAGFHAEGRYEGSAALFAVRYVFVLPDKTGMAYAVCFNDAFDAVELYPADSGVPYARATSVNSTAKSVNCVPCTFVAGTPVCLAAESFTVSAVTKIPALAYVEGEMDDEITLSLLTSFGLHPSVVGSFRAASEDIVSFVENGKEIGIYFEEGVLTFRSDGAGIPLSSVLKYAPGGTSYHFDDQMRAVRAFLRSIDPHLTGGDASLSLVGVSRRSDGTVFDLKYLKDGLIVTDHDADMTIVIGGDSITEVTMYPYEVHDIFRRLPVLPASLVLPEAKSVPVGKYTFGGDISDGVMYAVASEQ